MEQFTVLLEKKRKYKNSLPCPQCGTSLWHSCVRNAVKYVQGTKGKPQKIWNADLYKCPSCKNLVLTDFGRMSEWNKKNTPDLQALIDDWKKRGLDLIMHSWWFENNVGVSISFSPELLQSLSEILKRKRELDARADQLRAAFQKDGRAA